MLALLTGKVPLHSTLETQRQEVTFEGSSTSFSADGRIWFPHMCRRVEPKPLLLLSWAAAAGKMSISADAAKIASLSLFFFFAPSKSRKSSSNWSLSTTNSVPYQMEYFKISPCHKTQFVDEEMLLMAPDEKAFVP